MGHGVIEASANGYDEKTIAHAKDHPPVLMTFLLFQSCIHLVTRKIAWELPMAS